MRQAGARHRMTAWSGCPFNWKKAPTIDAGFEIKHIAQNAKAMRYRDSLKQTQDQLQATIERQAPMVKGWMWSGT